MIKLQQMLKELQHQVHWDSYYVDIFNLNMAKHQITTVGIVNGFYSDAKIIDFANDFWLDLPDDPVIRTGPFWLLCDIAEHCFDDGE